VRTRVVLTLKQSGAPSRNRRSKRHCEKAELDHAALADVRVGIRQGLEDVRQRRTRPAEQFFKEFEAAHKLVSVSAANIPPD